MQLIVGWPGFLAISTRRLMQPEEDAGLVVARSVKDEKLFNL